MPATAPESHPFDSSLLDRGFLSRFAVVGAILRSQETVGRDLAGHRHLTGYICSLFIATLVFTAAYGAVVGMFQPGIQIAFSAVKLPVVLLGTALLCTPTLYVFSTILGATLGFRQCVAFVFLMTAGVSTILAAFAPIAWFFTLSSGTSGFLSALHAVVFACAILYAARLAGAMRALLEANAGGSRVPPAFLVLWLLLVLVVGTQMTWNFRPFLDPGPFLTGTRSLCTEALQVTEASE